uniref:Cytochrome b n=1 Tax=Gordionus alpestris TaxID=1137640 RepID=A0A514ABW3_9BILA|nr:cytochrome b [Gordionus alpestris]QDH52413.1 cytochrome b [Gordionus alpestris]
MMNKSIRKSEMFNEINKFIIDLPTPPNINYWWNMGSITGLFFMSQFITGFFLSMHYISDINKSFFMVVSIENNIWEGFLLRNLHSMGASFMFIFIYLHIFRSLFYGSFIMNYKVWSSGVILLLLTMMTAFLGYVLPWGQMSYWAATVITNMISAIPILGKPVVIWIWGGFNVGDPTLNRFFSLHFILPFILLVLMMVHLILLHLNGSNNPLGIPSSAFKIPFHQTFSYKDIFGFMLPLFLFFVLIFLCPDLFTDVVNFIEANPLSTPPHIMPEWYFLFAYGILRSVPNKLGGVIALFMSIMIMYILLMSSKNLLIYNSLRKFIANLIASSFILLSYIGSQIVEPPFIVMGQMLSTIYFLLFFIMASM